VTRFGVVLPRDAPQAFGLVVAAAAAVEQQVGAVADEMDAARVPFEQRAVRGFGLVEASEPPVVEAGQPMEGEVVRRVDGGGLPVRFRRGRPVAQRAFVDLADLEARSGFARIGLGERARRREGGRGVLALLAEERDQLPVRLPMVRRERERATERGLGAVDVAALRAQEAAELLVDPRRVGVSREGPPEERLGLVRVPVVLAVERRKAAERPRVLRRVREDGAELRLAAGDVAELLLPQQAEPDRGRRPSGIGGRRAGVESVGPSQVFGAAAALREPGRVDEELRVVRRDFEGAGEIRFGAVRVVAEVAQEAPVIAEQPGVVRFGGESGAKDALGAFSVPQPVEEEVGIGAPDRGARRRQFLRGFVQASGLVDVVAPAEVETRGLAQRVGVVGRGPQRGGPEPRGLVEVVRRPPEEVGGAVQHGGIVRRRVDGGAVERERLVPGVAAAVDDAGEVEQRDDAVGLKGERAAEAGFGEREILAFFGARRGVVQEGGVERVRVERASEQRLGAGRVAAVPREEPRRVGERPGRRRIGREGFVVKLGGLGGIGRGLGAVQERVDVVAGGVPEVFGGVHGAGGEDIRTRAGVARARE
jgi:hypothetical protein